MPALHFQPGVPVFDANIGVGHRQDRPAPFEDTDGLLEEMHRHGVTRAVIYHVQGEALSCIDANEELMRWDTGGGVLTRQWTAGPGEESLEQLRALHQNGQVQCVRLHDIQANLSVFADWLYGDLLEWLQAEGIPLWISLADAAVAEVMDTLRKFPDLVTVLLGAHYTHALFVRPLLTHLPKAYLELSRYEVLGDLEVIVDRFGPERFVYGSFYPRYAMGPMLFYLQHIHLSGKDLAAVCAGNLERILAAGGAR